VSPALRRRGRPDFEPVHINTEFADQVSDHDPPIVRFQAPAVGSSRSASTPR
jgi:hypothetical protein